MILFNKINRTSGSMVEQRTTDPKVAGSNPAQFVFFIIINNYIKLKPHMSSTLLSFSLSLSNC